MTSGVNQSKLLGHLTISTTYCRLPQYQILTDDGASLSGRIDIQPLAFFAVQKSSGVHLRTRTAS